tara:strand:+ start:54 stop:320 length:267 start_codon:yes stop_codon:yes gene_type:complete
MKYQDLITKSQEEVSAEQLTYQVEDNKEQLEGDLKVTSRALTQDKRVLVELKSAKELDSTRILKQIDLITGRQLAIKNLKALIKELFD